MKTIPPFKIAAEGFRVDGNRRAAGLAAYLRSRGVPYTLIMHVAGRCPWNQQDHTARPHPS
jgi:hypothetical protein